MYFRLGIFVGFVGYVWVSVIALVVITGYEVGTPRLPACVNGAPEDVVVYRSEVPGEWDSCTAADNLVPPREGVDY